MFFVFTFVATTTRAYKGKVYQPHLLRRTYRDGGRVRHQTLGNLSHLPPDLIDVIRRRLRGERPEEGGHPEILRSLPHGHVAAVLATLGHTGLDRLLASRPSRERSLVVALIVSRVLKPGSKLATARALKEETAASSLSLELGLEDVDEDELYAAVDWLRRRLAPILFDDHQKEQAERTRSSIVAPAPRSAAARQKDLTKLTEEGDPVHSFQTLLTNPTPLQQRALDLLGVPLTV